MFWGFQFKSCRLLLPLLALFVACSLPAALHAVTIPEKLIYELSWTGIKVGIATQEIVEEGDVRKITSTASSNDWLSVFFPVEDKIESSLSKMAAFFPGQTKSFRMQMREGKNRRDREVLFDQEKSSAQYIDHISGEKLTIPISADTFDIYASFYYVRHLKLEVGQSIFVNVFYGKEGDKLEIKVVGKEKLKTVLGKVDTIIIRPLVKPKGVFEGKGSVQIWLTDDDRRIPVKAQTKVRVGSVIATLSGGNY